MRLLIVCGVLLVIQIILAHPPVVRRRDRLHRPHEHRGSLRRLVQEFRRAIKEIIGKRTNPLALIKHESSEQLEQDNLGQKQKQNRTETPIKGTTSVPLTHLASFEGTRCPTGSVRIYGRCVNGDY